MNTKTFFLVVASLVLVTLASCSKDTQEMCKQARAYLQGDSIDGKKVDPDTTRAFQLWSEAAELGDSTAMWDASVCLYNGWGTKTDSAKARKLWIESAEKGYAKAQYELGNDYWNEGFRTDEGKQKAATWWTKAAEKGYVEAQDELASRYFLGSQLDEAAYWAEKAAAQGSTKSADLLKSIKELQNLQQRRNQMRDLFNY